MSLKNGERKGVREKKPLKQKFKEVLEVKEFKYGIFIVLALIAILVLQILGLF